MSLASRLALALVFVAVLATALWGTSVRKTSRQLLESEFDARIEAATLEVREALGSEADQLESLTTPLCKRGTFFEKTLTDYERVKGNYAELETGTQLALRHHVPDEAAARVLDELYLVDPSGLILSSSDPKRLGKKDARLGALVKGSDEGKPRLRPEGTPGSPPAAVPESPAPLAAASAAAPTLRVAAPPAIEVHCARAVHGYRLGFVASRHISSILERVGRAHGVTLALADPEAPAPAPSEGNQVVRKMVLDDVGGLAVVATMPKERLAAALERLDREILASGAVAVAVALLFAIVLGRSLARPLRELAHETREVVSGEPRPVRSRGSREIRELADSFNKTIDELGKMKKRLAVTERIAARREIARQVAHEIKNPLAPIRAAVETLRRLRARDDARFDEYFDEATRTVLEEVHRIANIVSEFTKFQRLPAPNLEPMDLVQAAKHVVSLNALDPDQVRTGGASPTNRVELVTEGTLPQVRADRDQLVQVLTNLVQNGLEAAAAIRPDPRVVVTLSRQDEQHVRIVVRDNGPGVAEEMREKLFEAYATSKPTGTGLGLAICQRILFEHGGEIAYRPATKGGAVFEISLPIQGPSLLEKPLETTAQPVSRHQDPRHSDE